VALDAQRKTVTAANGESFRYQKLLLATGGSPRTLSIPGGDLPGICYYRDLDDYLKTRGEATEGKKALVIGGGFIGSELAAALNVNKLDVTMIFPSHSLASRVFPEDLGQAIQSRYQERGITILMGDRPAAFMQSGDKLRVHTSSGQELEAELVIVGVGILPEVKLAQGAGLEVADGIRVNQYLQSTHPDIYAAGDNALFPYAALGQEMRIEHWDNALHQGKWAGRNMAGAHEPFTYMPYIFSDLFEFGYEAVGEVSSGLETVTDWQKAYDTGVIYYLKGGRVRGAMMCNLWDKVESARELICKDEQVTPDSLRGTIQ
jgi:NADPH-dependent 2,4-dienoyl-CoA reductase/sulfur reductase-like enzyme